MNSIAGGRSRVLAWIIFGVLLMAIMMIPGGEHEKSQEWKADLNYNGVMEDYTLHQQQITVHEGGKTIWQSPPAWQVEEIAIGDVTNDGRPKLVFLLWKQGSYGPSQPFWENGENSVWSNHLFVYSLAGDRMKQVWCSSALSPPLQDLQIVTHPQNGENYLTARENRFGSRDIIHLKWDDWGFAYVK